MSQSIGISPELAAYLSAVNPPEHPVLRQCREETAIQFPTFAWYQVSPEQAAFMQFLLRIVRAKRAIEIGTFTGYSSLAFALTLREMHGHEAVVVTCDISEPWTSEAKKYWRSADVEESIDLRLRPALETLDELLTAGRENSFDFVFIDADKANTGAYYERSLQLLRPGGLLLVNNVLWAGAVIDPSAQDPDTNALRAIARNVKGDHRVFATVCGVGDGILMCIKR